MKPIYRLEVISNNIVKVVNFAALKKYTHADQYRLTKCYYKREGKEYNCYIELVGSVFTNHSEFIKYAKVMLSLLRD